MDHTLYSICLAGCCAFPVVDAREKSLMGALSCRLFRTFAYGSFRSWTISPLPQSVPRKNPNYICNPSAPFLDWRLNCASLVCHWRLFWIGLFSFAIARLKPIRRRHAWRKPPESRVLCTPAQKSNPSAPFLDRWLNCASLVCHRRHA